jgi:hypothetical protein
MKLRILGHGWAQPVVSKRWALWCSILEFVSKMSGRRILSHKKHTAWERACGIDGMKIG